MSELIGKKVVVLSTNSLLKDLTGKIGVICDYSCWCISVEIYNVDQIISLYEGEYTFCK